MREFRAAWHSLRRDTALALVVVLMLATAIAATTTIFSIVHAVLLRPLAFADPERVVLVWTRNDARNAPVVEVSLGELRERRARSTSLRAIDVFGSVNWSYRVTAPGEPFTVAYSSVTASFFETLGAPQGAKPRWLTVVGVVEDARYRELTEARYDLYLPFRQALPGVKHYVVRTKDDPLSLVPAIREAVKRIDRRLTAENVTTMNQIVARTVAICRRARRRPSIPFARCAWNNVRGATDVRACTS